MNRSCLKMVCIVLGLAAGPLAIADESPAPIQSSPVVKGSLEENDRVAVLGDSITEQKNYSVLIEDYLLACQPAPKLSVTQFGWGGETTWGLAPRLQHDILWFHPTVATVNYGMNDGGYRGIEAKRLADYQENTKSIIEQLKADGCRLIVIGGPGAVDPDSFRTFVAHGRADGER